MSAPSFIHPAAPQPADAVLGLLAVRPDERVLDIGCGDGGLTAQLAGLGAELVGFDINPEQVMAARARGLEVKRGNAEELYFHQEFDAVFSHDALHEMRHAEQVASGAFMALKPGGRFVAELAGNGHAALVRQALHGALERRSIDVRGLARWYLPTACDYLQLLERVGFHVNHISWFEQPQVLDRPIGDWIKTFCSQYLKVLPMELRIPFLEEVTEELVGELLDASGRWTVDATRLRFRALRQA